MADTKIDTKASATPIAETPPQRSQILKQGKEAEPVAAFVPIAAAGNYKVTHGTISFGNGEVALTGAIVSLSSVEASLMMPMGVIELA